MAEPYDPIKTKAMMMALRAGRNLEQEHPWAATAIGLIPGVGTVTGAASALASYEDPSASWGERALNTLGMLPLVDGAQALIKALRGAPSSPAGVSHIIGGDEIIDRLKQSPDIERVLKPKYFRHEGIDDPYGPNLERAFMLDPPVNWEKLNKRMHDLTEMVHNSPDPNFKVEAPRYWEFIRGTPEGKAYKDLLPELERLEIAGHWDRPIGVGNYAPASEPWLPRINYGLPGRNNPNAARNVVSHELQHYIQDFEENPSGWFGTSPAAAGGYNAYMLDRGEMEARLNEYLNWGSPHYKPRVSRQLDLSRALRDMEDNIRTQDSAGVNAMPGAFELGRLLLIQGKLKWR